MPRNSASLLHLSKRPWIPGRPVLADFYCCAGGAGMGFYRAGFNVVGFDVKPQPLYPFEFVQMDALEALADVDLMEQFSAAHGSPPCQAFTHGRHLGNRGRDDHPRLIEATRDAFEALGLPYVIENVEDARAELRSPYMLCGSAFGLDVQRHRLFETTFPMMVPGCQHYVWTEKKHPGTPREDGSRPLSKIVNPMASGTTHEAFATAMGIDWIPKRGKRPAPELHEAIPPAYTEFIGGYLMAEVAGRAAA